MVTIGIWFSITLDNLATNPILYSITGGNLGNAFGVHNTSGAIYVANHLDYETRPRVSNLLLASLIFS